MNKRLINPMLIVLLVLALGGLYMASTRHRVNTLLVTSPKAATITIDGTKQVSAGSYYLTPGKHTLVASFSGFSDTTQSFTVTKNRPVKVYFLLMPNSDAGNAYLKKHSDEQTTREQLGGQQFDNNSALIRKIYPILSLLPHEGPNYTINYGKSLKHPDDPQAIALYITVPAVGQEAPALNWIGFSGYNPDDYEIIYQYQGERD